MEILANHSVQYLLKNDYKVYELCCSGGHYGTTIDKFKGKPLQKIRKEELKEAARQYALNTNYPTVDLTHWEYIDGHLPVDQSSIARFQNFIHKISPQIVIAPDPFFALDYHPDHINSGLNVYYALKSSPMRDRIHYFLFQTIKPNYFISYQDSKVQTRVLAPHRSQLTPLQTKLIPKFARFLYRMITPWKLPTSEPLRKVTWESQEIWRLKHRIWYRLLQGVGQPPLEQFHPPPEELGLC